MKLIVLFVQHCRKKIWWMITICIYRLCHALFWFYTNKRILNSTINRMRIESSYESYRQWKKRWKDDKNSNIIITLCDLCLRSSDLKYINFIYVDQVNLTWEWKNNSLLWSYRHFKNGINMLNLYVTKSLYVELI